MPKPSFGWLVELDAPPGETEREANLRLQRALKCLGRSFRLKCRGIVPKATLAVDGPGSDPPPPDAPQANVGDGTADPETAPVAAWLRESD